VGFARAKALAPGETRGVSVRVDPRDAFVWDVITQQPVVETGRYDLMVGASSADIRLATTIHVTGHTIGTLDLTTTRNVWEYYTISHGVSHWEVSKANTLARRGGYHSVASRRAGDHVGFTRVELGGGINGIELRVATTTASWTDVSDPAVEVRINRPTGPLLGTLRFDPTGGPQDFTTVRAPLHIRSTARHTDNLYLVFRTGGIYLDTIQLLPPAPNE
jgi:beta-glucosidase